MLRYICRLPNERNAAPIHQLISADPAKLEAFAREEDQAGFGIYECIAPLLPGATRRNLGTVAGTDKIYVDVDTRKLADAHEDVLRKLQQLPLRPEIHDSGGGYHVIWTLKELVPRDTPEFRQLEDLRGKLIHALCGDPEPNHAAALIRKVGTHNSRYEGALRQVQIVQEAAPVTALDLEALVDLVGDAPLFTWLPKPKSNGHDHAEGAPRTAGEHAPVDVGQRLADMTFKGPGDSAIHHTQLQVTASLLRNGQNVESTVAEVLEATRNAVTGNPKAANWNWADEKLDIERMCFDFVNKNPELAMLMPERFYAGWQERLAAGRINLRMVHSSHIGWHIRSNDPEEETEETPKTKDIGTKDDKPRQKRDVSFVLRPFVPFDLAKLPPRQWLYGRHYQRGTVSATIAPGGFGKTTLCMVETVAMATGRNLLGEQPTERLRCWYHNGEDTLEELNRRLGAICLHYKIPQEELRSWFFMTSGNEVPLRVAQGYSELKIDEPLIKCITAEVKRNEIDVAVLDPLVTLHGVPEGDNSKMDHVIRIFAAIADSQECAVELAHHTRKLPPGANGTDYVAADIRGATATRDAVRAARMLNQMTEKDAENTGIPEHERVAYFRVDRVKGNNSPAAKAVWRRFVNVVLPNTDEVGVVVPWEFPGQGAPSEQMAAAEQAAEAMFMQLLIRFTLENRVASDRQGMNSAPLLFSREPEAKAARISKAALAAAMLRLFAKKRIRAEDSGEPGHKVHRIIAI
jgi:RecA-family ATPase